jgi:flagellar biosynthesis chaperone FliJ
MSTTGKVLIGLYIVILLPLIWLAASVLEARRNWAKAVVAKDVQVLEAEVKLLAVPLDQNHLENLAAQIKEAAIPEEGRTDLASQVTKLLEERTKYDNAVAEFEKATLDYNGAQAQQAFHQSLENLLKAQRAQPPQEDEIAAARNTYVNAYQQLLAVQKRFDDSFTKFSTDMREMAATGHATETLIQALARVQRTRTHLDTWKNVQLSDYDVYRSRYTDMVSEFLSRRQQLLASADAAQAEQKVREEETEGSREKLGLSEEQIRGELADRKLARMSADDIENLPEQVLRDALRQDLGDPDLKFVRHVKAVNVLVDDDLAKSKEILQKRQGDLKVHQDRFNGLVAENRKLAVQIERNEKEVDRRRGIPTVVASEGGPIPKGKITSLDDQAGTVTINIGLRAGVTPGVRLHVYRLEPKPQHLGFIEILKAESDSATGRINPQFRQLPIQVGDIVAPEVTP